MDKEDEESRDLDPNEDIYDKNDNRSPLRRNSNLNASRDPFNNEIQPDFFRDALNNRDNENMRGPYYEYEPEKTKNEEQLGDFTL